MNDLWERFHGVVRPDGPSADDASEALGELGLRPSVERWASEPRAGGFEDRADAVALLRRRLCPPPIATASSATRSVPAWNGAGPVERGPADQPLVTIWFDP